MQEAQYSARFWSKVHKTETCWLWASSLSHKGYGYFYWQENGEQRRAYAHRFAYALAHGGELPEAVHHACEVKHCVNPEHLIGTTHTEHQSEYHVGDTCARGHALTDDNLYIVVRDDRPPYRMCRTCRLESSRRWDRIKKERCEAKGHPARPGSKRGLCMCGWTTRVNQPVETVHA